MARRGAKSAGFWMIQRDRKQADDTEIRGIITILADVGIPFAVSVNAFFFILDM